MTQDWTADEESVNDAISRSLAALIRDVPADQRLPSEREMSEALGVSRVALRDRLKAFENIGILERRQGAGTFVRPLDSNSLSSMLDLLLATAHVSRSDLHVVRVALERESARQAAAADAVDLEEMYRCVSIFQHSKSRAEVAAADARFHGQLLRATESRGLMFFADALQSALFNSMAYRNERWSERVRSEGLLVDLHLQIIRGIESGDPELAARAVDSHFSTFDAVIASEVSDRVD